jgi:hypothetical protein
LDDSFGKILIKKNIQNVPFTKTVINLTTNKISYLYKNKISMLKAGLVGAGHLGKIHLRLLNQSDKYEL